MQTKTLSLKYLKRVEVFKTRAHFLFMKLALLHAAATTTTTAVAAAAAAAVALPVLRFKS